MEPGEIVETVEVLEAIAETGSANAGEVLVNTPVIDYTGYLDMIIDLLESINGFLFRLCQVNEFSIAVIITVVLCVIYYKYLHYFTRF